MNLLKFFSVTSKKRIIFQFITFIDQFTLYLLFILEDNKFSAPKNLIYLVTVKIFYNNKNLLDIF